MLKLHFPLWMAGLAVIALPQLSTAQAFVEYGLATAGSGVAGAPGQRVGSGIGGIFSSLTKSLDAAKENAAAATASPAAPARAAAPPVAAASAKPAEAARPAGPPKPPQPAVTYEDPAGIREGMEQAELLRRFGPPAMQITTGAGRESLTYAGRAGSVEVEVRDGKVASVAAKTKPKQQSAVVRL